MGEIILSTFLSERLVCTKDERKRNHENINEYYLSQVRAVRVRRLRKMCKQLSRHYANRNTAEDKVALFSLTTGEDNTATGVRMIRNDVCNHLWRKCYENQARIS
jgi:hypothetical protein